MGIYSSVNRGICGHMAGAWEGEGSLVYFLITRNRRIYSSVRCNRENIFLYSWISMNIITFG
jgi:hypothetical protein